MASPAGGTIVERITDLIGSDAFSDTVLTNEVDLINAAINEVADSISEDLLLKYSSTPLQQTSATGTSVEGKKVLKVIRVDANSGGYERECIFLDRVAFSSARDSTSIYYATAHSPVYHIDSMNDSASKLYILPICNGSGQEGNIWNYSYIADSTDTTAMTGAILNSTYYLPSELIHAIALKASSNILQAYISNQVQDEEDSEMLSMVGQQMQAIEASYKNEIQRFMDESGKPGGE
jgi:hypothetical protein